MACCSSTAARALTPLAQYAKSLNVQLDGLELHMEFPMYTVSLGTLVLLSAILSEFLVYWCIRHVGNLYRFCFERLSLNPKS